MVVRDQHLQPLAALQRREVRPIHTQLSQFRICGLSRWRGTRERDPAYFPALLVGPGLRVEVSRSAGLAIPSLLRLLRLDEPPRMLWVRGLCLCLGFERVHLFAPSFPNLISGSITRTEGGPFSGSSRHRATTNFRMRSRTSALSRRTAIGPMSAVNRLADRRARLTRCRSSWSPGTRIPEAGSSSRKYRIQSFTISFCTAPLPPPSSRGRLQVQ